MLHISHARNEVEVALTVIGFGLTLLGLGIAIMALWPRTPGRKTERIVRRQRRRTLREVDASLLDEDVDRGA